MSENTINKKPKTLIEAILAIPLHWDMKLAERQIAELLDSDKLGGG